MFSLQALIPGRGNPMRPVLIIVAVAFAVMLIVFPALMYIAGVGTGGTIAVALLIAVVTLGCLALLRMMGETYAQDHQVMLAGHTWAAWRLTADEHRRFLDDERRRTRRLAAAYTLGDVALGLVIGAVADDWLTGGIMIRVFLCVGVITLTLAGPPREADGEAGRDVKIGPDGVQILGRYLPFNAPLMRPQDVRFQTGSPAVLRFTVRTGRRVEEVRMPVPHESMAEAEALVERFRLDEGWRTG